MVAGNGGRPRRIAKPQKAVIVEVIMKRGGRGRGRAFLCFAAGSVARFPG
jgi:hypothetical protein